MDFTGKGRYVLMLALVATLVCNPGTTQSQKTGPSDQALIEGILSAQQKAWNDGNVEEFMKGYWRSEELTFSGSNGVSRGFNAVRERYHRNYPDRQTMGKLDFSGLEFHFLGKEGALVLGRWHLTREKGDVGGVFSLVFQRFPEGWRIIHDHTSVVAASDSK